MKLLSTFILSIIIGFLPIISYAGCGFPNHIQTNEKVLIISPKIHTWAAYDANGILIRCGQASAGKNYCPDTGARCRTSVGTFRIYKKGGPGCVSGRFPLPNGGAPMPYCMFFHNGMAVHGHGYIGDANASHGCVRVSHDDAEWLSGNFIDVGTKVIVKSY